MSTTAEYNGITFRHVLTKQIEEESARDPSGTDFLYHRVQITIQGYVHPTRSLSSSQREFYGPNVLPNDAGNDAVAVYRDIHHRLMEPRKSFVMRMGIAHFDDTVSGSGAEAVPNPEGNPEHPDMGKPIDGSGSILFEAHPATGSTEPYDLANGPNPKKLSITKVIGANCFWVTFTIELCIRGCESASSGYVLSHRWTTSDVRDNNKYLTRQFDGKLILSTADVNPHSFRGLCTPVLQPGMRRDRMTFVCSEDGLTLSYSITDREIAFAAPAPATSMSLQHSMAVKDGSTSSGYTTVRLEAPSTARHDELIQLALRLVESRVGRRPNFDILRELQITSFFGEVQAVEARAEVMFGTFGAEDFTSVLVRAGTDLGRPIMGANPQLANYDRRISIDPGTAGPISVVGAISAKLQSSCDSNQHGLCNVGQPADDLGFTEGSDCFKTSVEAYAVPSSSDVPNPILSDEHQQFLYTYYRSTAKYFIDSHRAAMPIGRDRGNPSSTSPVTVVRLGPEVAHMTLRISGERVGKAVGLPKPAKFTDSPTGITYHLLDYRIHPESVGLTADAKQIFKCDAEYDFVLDRTPTEEEQLRVPSVPWLSSPTKTVPITSGAEM